MGFVQVSLFLPLALLPLALLPLVAGGLLPREDASTGADPGRITTLPGADFNISFTQYSGFVTVNQSHGRKLFYWFVTSQSNPKADPVVLWLNGGPGCSSLAGFFTELGPFYPLEGGRTLAQNPYSWNKVANVVFLESPSGVGFSYSATPADYKTGDQQTTEDSVQFLIEFFKLYPEYAGNDFWITGESYGGHYVPWLADAVLEHNARSPSNAINLKGFMAGNPWTDPASDNFGTAQFWVNSGIVSRSTFNTIKDNCNFSVVGPFVKGSLTAALDVCDGAVEEATREMGDINQYAIYANVCLQQRLERDLPFMGIKDQDPCIGGYLLDYLRRDDVIAAIHASESPNRWTECSGEVDYSRQDLLTPVLPLYRKLFAENKLRILIYSGDVDGVVAHTGTEMWMELLNLTVKQAFQPWLDSNKEVGGWIVHYAEMTYATVRGAGHMVPGTQPRRALDVFSAFLAGTL